MNSPRGFTLIETIIAMAVIGIAAMAIVEGIRHLLRIDTGSTNHWLADLAAESVADSVTSMIPYDFHQWATTCLTLGSPITITRGVATNICNSWLQQYLTANQNIAAIQFTFDLFPRNGEAYAALVPFPFVLGGYGKTIRVDVDYIRFGDRPTQTERHTWTKQIPAEGISEKLSFSPAGTAAGVCVLNDHGRAFCWGNNASGAIGDNYVGGEVAFPMALQSYPQMTRVAVGHSHSCGVTPDGEVICWGGRDISASNFYKYEFDDETADGTKARTYRYILDSGGNRLKKVTEIAAGYNHFCAVSAGIIHCWGDSSNGKLGWTVAGSTPVTTPTAVSGLDINVDQVVAGKEHTCALIGGEVFCFGSNTNSQLGTPTGGSTSTAVRVTRDSDSAPLRRVAEIASGAHSVCARTFEGEIWCWGGKSGANVRAAQISLSGNKAMNLSGAITVGDAHACAILSVAGTPTVRCWQASDIALFEIEPLGRASGSGPVPASLDSWPAGVVPMALTALPKHTCAIVDAGDYTVLGKTRRAYRVYCWGIPGSFLGPADLIQNGGKNPTLIVSF